MPLVTTKQLLLDAREKGYAVGAFNVENMEMVAAVTAAAQALRAPVILQTTPSTVKYCTLPQLAAMVRTAAEQVDIPVALHLDHGESFDLAMQALRMGYSSIMIDGSHQPFDKNIELSRRVAEVCKPMGIPVEAELGKVGGKEDDLDGGSGGYTDPGEAAEFVMKTGVDSLAVGIGTAHGIYVGTPVLDVERLSEIAKVVTIPLVLHGASGLSDQAVRDCIGRGICKVNFATELRIAFSDGVKRVLADNPSVFDPKKYGAAGMAEVRKLVTEKMMLCGCDNKA